MKKLNEYSTYEEVKKDFDKWFSYWLTGYDADRGWTNEKRTIDDFTDDVIDVILYITEWNEEIIKNTNKWNIVYWYCVRFLYFGVDDENLSLEEVYEFLDGMTPFN